MAYNNNNNNNGAQSQMDSLIQMNDLQQLLEKRGITLEDFTNLYTKVLGDTSGESYGQMRGYYTPELYHEWQEEYGKDITEKGMSTASNYMDELRNRYESKGSAPNIGGGGGGMQREPEKMQGIMALLQRLLPGGKTGYR